MVVHVAMVGAKLKRWRERKGLSQAAAGALVGCSQAMFGALEKGSKKPGVDLALAIERETGGGVRVRDWASAPRAA